MARRGENIFKRKDGRWEGRYKKGQDSSGKSLYGYVYAKTYKDVKQKLDEVKAKVILTNIQEPSVNFYTFQKASAQWIESISDCTKESTRVKYQNLLNNHILPELGEYDIYAIHSDVLETYARQKINTGRLDGMGGLSVSTVQTLLVIIRSILNYSSDGNHIPVCRSNKIRFKKGDIPLKTMANSRLCILEKYLLANESVKNTGILMCLYMGLRIGEICALKWECILLDEGKIYIHRTMQRIQDFSGESTKKTKVIITEPKSRSSVRDIPIPGFLLTILKRLASDNMKGFFLTGKENHFIEPRSYQNYYRRILEINQIPYLNFHSLRHTFATRCVEAGVDAKSLSEMLGHSKVNITFDRYVHASLEMKRKNIEKLPTPI